MSEPSISDADQWITTNDLCKMLRVHKSTVTRRLATDPRFPRPARLPGIITKRFRRFRLADVREYMRMCQQEQ